MKTFIFPNASYIVCYQLDPPWDLFISKEYKDHRVRVINCLDLDHLQECLGKIKFLMGLIINTDNMDENNRERFLDLVSNAQCLKYEYSKIHQASFIPFNSEYHSQLTEALVSQFVQKTLEFWVPPPLWRTSGFCLSTVL